MINANYQFLFRSFKFLVPYTKNTIVELQHPYPAIIGVGSILTYLTLILFIFPSTAPKSESGKKKMESGAKIHFTLLCLYSTFACGATIYHLTNNGEFSDLSKFICEPIPEWLRLLSITFTLSKVWEWVDTAIDIWRGKSLKKIGFLHCYHHATTLILFLVVMNFPGAEKSGMLLNGFVHSLMYYHYAFRLPHFMRPIITSSQIIQLVTVTYIWHVTPSTCPAYMNFSKDNFVEFLLPYTLVPVYTFFFILFFFEQYISPKKDSKKVK
jgi:hypothetical protein